MKRSYLILLAGLGGLGLLFFFSQGGKQRPEEAGRYGVLPGAYDPKEFGEKENYSLSYYVPLPHPAKSALDFYVKSLKKRGWKPDPNWKGMGEQEKWTSWSAPSALAREGLICAYQLNKGFVHKDGKKFLLLILNYYDTLKGAGCEPSPRSGELMVTLQEMPKQ
jgi:hypothetical protein